MIEMVRDLKGEEYNFHYTALGQLLIFIEKKRDREGKRLASCLPAYMKINTKLLKT